MLKSWINKNFIGVLELNSPASRNALSKSLLQNMLHSIQRMERNPDIRVIIIQAATASTSSSVLPVFSSGHDLKEIQKYQRAKEVDKLRDLFSLSSHVMMSIANSSKPYIAKVDGLTSAAGCQLVAMCDLTYSTERSLFVLPGVNIGVFCSTPSVGLIYRGIAKRHLMEMLLTGESITAQKAQEIGLINQVFLNEVELNVHIDHVVAKISSKSPEAIRIGKPLVCSQMSLPLGLEEAYAQASQSMATCAMTHDAQEGISAFLSKRFPNWK